MLLQAGEAETMITRQRARTLHFIVREADPTRIHGILMLPLQTWHRQLMSLTMLGKAPDALFCLHLVAFCQDTLQIKDPEATITLARASKLHHRAG
jgi:hypothetical protein